jgi:phage I-like protein
MSKPLTTTTAAIACLAVTALGDEPPKRVMLFSAGGTIRTRDGRSYRIDLAKLAARFAADGVKIPIDINHATEILAPQGKRADPVGWITAVEIEGVALLGSVEWIDPSGAIALLRAYPYVSPAFPAPKGEAEWLKSVALVASPALGNQPALAAADPDQPQEIPMKTVFAALGLAETASEAECLAAVITLKTKSDPATTVAKAIHDETVAKLAAATAELTKTRDETRKGKVDAVIEGALKAKKILPAQKDHYVSLCATDEGLAAVEALLAASPELLAASGLGDKPVPDADVVQLSAEDKAVMTQLGLTEEAYREANGLKQA